MSFPAKQRRTPSLVARRAASRTAACVCTLAFVLLCAASSARAQTTDNVLYGVDFLAADRVMRIDPVTAQAVQAGTLSFGTASAARHPTSGLIYYTEYDINGSNNRVATWNPTTGTNQIINNTGLNNQPQIVRLTFRADGVLYGMNTSNRLYTINTTNGTYTSVGVMTLANGTALPQSTGGDLAFSPTGTLYLLMNGDLYTVALSNPPRATLVGATGVPSPTGLTFGPNGQLYATDLSGNSTLYLVDPVTPANSAAVAQTGMSITDLAAKPNFANVSVAKTATSTFAVGNVATYRLAVANTGPASASGPITVTDTLPAGLSYSSYTGTNWACITSGTTTVTVTCTHPGPIAVNASLPNLTLSVAVAEAAAPNVTNTATVASTTFDHVTPNNTSTVTTPVLYVRLVKSHVVNGPQPRPGTEITYTIAFSNLGGANIRNFYLVDIIPFSVNLTNSTIVRSTEFKVGSMTFTPGTSTLTLNGLRYFSDAVNFPAPTPPWNPSVTYAPSGTYDPAVTYVGWQFNGQMPPNTSGSVSFVVRIR